MLKLTFFVVLIGILIPFPGIFEYSYTVTVDPEKELTWIA
jgi:hypothetical protein